MPNVSFTGNLKRFYPLLESMEIEASNLSDLLNRINNIHPGIKDYIVDENGKLRKHVNIFIGNEMIIDKEELSDEINDQDNIFIMQALSGG